MPGRPARESNDRTRSRSKHDDDAATRTFGPDHPHLLMPGAGIEITEIMPIPGT
jgi:hypothetical protein